MAENVTVRDVKLCLLGVRCTPVAAGGSGSACADERWQGRRGAPRPGTDTRQTAGVGKSSLVNRFAYGVFNENYATTNG